MAPFVVKPAIFIFVVGVMPENEVPEIGLASLVEDTVAADIFHHAGDSAAPTRVWVPLQIHSKLPVKTADPTRTVPPHP